MDGKLFASESALSGFFARFFSGGTTVKLKRLLLLPLALFGLAVVAVGQQGSASGSTAAAWVQLGKLSPSDVTAYSSGRSIAIAGNVIVVGDDHGQRATVFVMPKGGWENMVQTAILKASDESSCGVFGNSVSMSGNTIVVGDPQNYCTGHPGAAYVFVEPAGGWSGTLTETAKLTATDAVSGDGVGYSISIDSNTVVAGAPYQGNSIGAAYVFVKPASGWTNATQTAKLTASDSNQGEFGLSVSVSGNAVVAGAPYRSQAAGAAYVYVEPIAGWTNATQTAELTASDGQSTDGFAYSVSISRQIVAVGANNSNQGQGAAYVFVEPTGGWTSTTQAAKLTVSSGFPSDELGSSVATNGSFVVAGAPYFSNSANDLTSPYFHEGAAYIFVKPASGWANQTQPAAKLNGSDARLGAYFGTSVALQGTTVAAGAIFNNRNIGASYVFGAFSAQ
jgi:hypothetical protein